MHDGCVLLQYYDLREIYERRIIECSACEAGPRTLKGEPYLRTEKTLCVRMMSPREFCSPTAIQIMMAMRQATDGR